MKQYFGKSYNIAQTQIGLITFKSKVWGSKSDNIYVTNDSKIPSGFLAVISSHDNIENTSKRVIAGIDSISELNEGDIVTIEEDGTVNVVFDITSNHNALFITARCNSNCIMCPQPPIQTDGDRFDLNAKYISLMDKNTKNIGITGGEPTLIGEQLFELISKIHKRTPKASINLLSNGIMFEDYNYALDFAKSIKQDLVVDIPLYSDIDTIHNSIVRTNTFYRTINGIYNLARNNIKIGLRIVIHKMNYKRLVELSEYIYSNFPFVFHVAFMQMEPMGYAKDNFDDLWIDPVDYNNELEKAVLNLHYRDINVSIYNSQLCILPVRLRRFAVQSISDWKNIYIDECEGCELKEQCPGFFASSKEIHSRSIAAVKGLQTESV
jgi:His-Xaa-Ser system radical SAM maturase HxsC